jgi:hypothetical protein
MILDDSGVDSAGLLGYPVRYAPCHHLPGLAGAPMGMIQQVSLCQTPAGV